MYVPLPHVRTIYYRDVDMYRYYIGREDQSVNESVMKGRIDQQLRVTRLMIDAVQLPDAVPEKRLERYMENYLSMMMCICSIFLRMIGTDEAEDKREGIWDYLKEKNPDVYRRIRRSVLNMGTNLPTRAGPQDRHHRLPHGPEDIQVQLGSGGSTAAGTSQQREAPSCRIGTRGLLARLATPILLRTRFASCPTPRATLLPAHQLVEGEDDGHHGEHAHRPSSAMLFA